MNPKHEWNSLLKLIMVLNPKKFYDISLHESANESDSWEIDNNTMKTTNSVKLLDITLDSGLAFYHEYKIIECYFQ